MEPFDVSQFTSGFDSENYFLSKSSSVFLSHSPSLITSPQVDMNTVMKIYHQLRPVTLASHDAYGNTIQLWKAGIYGLIGSVVNLSGDLKIIRAEKIINPFCSIRAPLDLLSQLEGMRFHVSPYIKVFLCF